MLLYVGLLCYCTMALCSPYGWPSALLHVGLLFWPSVLWQHTSTSSAARLFLQAELNKLDVVVSLKLNQLYCMDNVFDGSRAPEGTEEVEKPR